MMKMDSYTLQVLNAAMATGAFRIVQEDDRLVLRKTRRPPPEAMEAILNNKAGIAEILSPARWSSEITGASSDTRGTKSQQGGRTTPTARSI
jgi:hypothetical protein